MLGPCTTPASCLSLSLSVSPSAPPPHSLLLAPSSLSLLSNSSRYLKEQLLDFYQFPLLSALRLIGMCVYVYAYMYIYMSLYILVCVYVYAYIYMSFSLTIAYILVYFIIIVLVATLEIPGCMYHLDLP